MSDDETQSLSNKQYLHASRTDDLALLHSLLLPHPTLTPNHTDGLGNNALHYAAAHQSTGVLAEILNLEIDVDQQNRTHANTPLHAAVGVDLDLDAGAGAEEAAKREEIRNWIVNELLEAGADPRIQNRDGDRPVDLLAYGRKGSTPLGKQLVERLKRAEAEVAVDQSDIAHDDDDDDGSEGTPSDDDE